MAVAFLIGSAIMKGKETSCEYLYAQKICADLRKHPTGIPLCTKSMCKLRKGVSCYVGFTEAGSADDKWIVR